MKFKIFLLFLIIIGFFYRIYGLNANYSFWTDENHVAIFARAILERGKPVLANGFFTPDQQLQYWLSAASAKIFGLNEFAIRFPSVIFGVLTIWAVYVLGKELFGKEVGLMAAIFTTFLKIEILWSRQARPYQALQFFFLLGIFFTYKLIKEEKFNWRYFLGFLISGFLASLMHGLGLVIFLVGFVYLLISGKLGKIGFLIFLGVLGVFVGAFQVQIFSVVSQIGKINNLFYYRVFLWHNYPLLVFLAFVGFLSCLFQKRKEWQIIALVLVVQGTIASFLLGEPFTRYFYIVFPFLILFSSVGLELISASWGLNVKPLALFILVFFIVGMGNKFTLFPQKIYSLNADMQEIPEVDWKRVYWLVEKRIKESPGAILVTNWNDLPIWYLSEGSLDFLTRKPVGVENAEKDQFSSAKIIHSLQEFKIIINDNPKGFFVVDSWDDRIPEGIREYARDNLKKELEIDRLYDTQPRLWPVGVYSWGM
ncbi:MAG: ArnT family glycosyltransferase [Patescibacteria group bacterium]